VSSVHITQQPIANSLIRGGGSVPSGVVNIVGLQSLQSLQQHQQQPLSNIQLQQQHQSQTGVTKIMNAVAPAVACPPAAGKKIRRKSDNKVNLIVLIF